MRYGHVILVAACCSCILASCGGTEPTRKAPSPPSGEPVRQEEQRRAFETRTDTVNTMGPLERGEPQSSPRAPQIRFMVQVGAYKDPTKASQIQVAARERYHLPVINDYHPTLGLYQIRIGFFESREAAGIFRQQMIYDYPQDYKDSWIVQLKR